MADGGNVGARGSGKSLKKDSIALSRCTSQARLPLLERSLRLSSAAQLSGKAHEDFDHTVVITVLH